MDHNYSTTPERARGQHLKFEDRCSIKICKKLGLSLRKIATVVDCAASTVLNELRRGTSIRSSNRGRPPEYSAKRGQANYEINRTRCHKPHKLEEGNPFIDWVVKQVREKNWSLDVCVGYARRRKLFPKEQIVCAKTLCNEVWAGNLPLTALDLPEALSRKPKKKLLANISGFSGRALMNVLKKQ